MPKGFRSGRARGGAATIDTTEDTLGTPAPTTYSSLEETDTMTTVTSSDPDVSTEDSADDDTATQFEFSMEPAPTDYQPERKVPGRQRRTSFFDTKLRSPEVYDKGWQRVPVNSPEHKEAVIRELNRAKLYLNGTGRNDGEPEIGLDLDDKQDDAVYFKARLAQKRERKDKTNGSVALTDNADAEGMTDPNGDNDE